MELLARAFRTCRRLLSPNGWFTLGVMVAVLALEAVGRFTTSDLHDALAMALLGLLVCFIVYRHRISPLPWASRLAQLGQWLFNWARGWTFEIGIDLRGNPRIKRGYPPGILALGLFLVTWCGLLLVFGSEAPHALRSYGVTYFYTGYLVFITLLWALLLAGILLAFFIPMAMIHDAFVSGFDGPGRRPRQPEMLTILVFFGTCMFLGWLFPVWVSLGLCAVALLINIVTTTIPANHDVQFIWRPRQSIKVRAMPWMHWIVCEFTLITLVVFDLVLTSCGPRVLMGELAGRSAMPATAMLGTILAWMAPGLLTAMVWQSVMGRWRDPARRSRPIIHVGGTVLTSEVMKSLHQMFRVHNWRAVFAPADPDSCAVQIELVDPAQSQALEFDPTWPLKVSLRDLGDPRVHDRLLRRSEIQMRRRITSALEKMFKWAARRDFSNGHGFWVAPHFWFILGLSRDAQEEEVDLAESTLLSGTIGPAYYRLIPRLARHHLFHMLRALHVDLIFVEDGVSFRRFVKVLRRLFEIYDKNEGKKRAEDIHFVGMPGTRVMIHEFQLDEPFKSETYPEPKYDFLGRARILHIFRDRQEQEEFTEPPFDFSRTPAPAATG
jgi:hypothetical protein